MTDQWAQWFLKHRHGDEGSLPFLYAVRDKVLANCALMGDETLLDVGCGDGLIGFGALDQFDVGRVLFSDISQDLLDHVAGLAAEMGVLESCSFIQANAEDLIPIENAAVDVVTLRSVLIYIEDKAAAFEAFYRVLKPGGTLSLFEPINRFTYPEPEERLSGYDVAPVVDLAAKVKAVYAAIQPSADPMMNFDERDLLRWAEAAGFREIHLEYVCEIVPNDRRVGGDWAVFLQSADNPKIPPIGEVIQQALMPEEYQQFTQHLKPLVEGYEKISRRAICYLWAEKPR